MRRLLVTANVVPSSAIFFTYIMKALLSSETSVPTRVTRRNIPEDDILGGSYLPSVAPSTPLGWQYACISNYTITHDLAPYQAISVTMFTYVTVHVCVSGI
jgi:hypothetical protein